MRPVYNVFQKLSCTEQRREGVAAYLWYRQPLSGCTATVLFQRRPNIYINTHTLSLIPWNTVCEFNSVNVIMEAHPGVVNFKEDTFIGAPTILTPSVWATVWQKGRICRRTVQKCKLPLIQDRLYSMESTRPVLAFTHVDTRQVEKATTISVPIDLYICG